MYTLDIKYFKKQSIIYFLISILCFTFSMIYEHYSHDVYSNYMIFAFIIPLIFGFLVSFLIWLFNIKTLPNALVINLYNASIATFTIGSIMAGVLEIYGTTNSLVYIYPLAGGILLILSILIYVISIIVKKIRN